MKERSVYLATALECIDRIAEYTAGMTKDAFLEDHKTQDAVVRNLEIIGQSSRITELMFDCKEAGNALVTNYRNAECPGT